MIKVFILLTSFSIYAVDITVPLGGNIQDAIDDVNESGGGTVTLAAGTFTVTSSLKIKSNVTLQGSGIYASTIATTQNIKIIEQSGYGLSNITIRNLTLKGTNKVDGGGMDIISYGTDHDTILISNVRCYNTGWGVHIKGAKNVLIENCDFSENGAIGKEGFAHNLYLRRVYGAIVKNSSLNNSISGNGINISYSEDVEIRDSEMIGNFFRGVRAAVSIGYLVHDCIISDNIEIGIFANSETNGFTTTDIDIQNNCVSGSKDGIRVISGATGIVMNNNSYDNDDDYDITSSVSDVNNISDPNEPCDGSVQPPVCDSHDAFSTIQAEDYCDESGIQLSGNAVGYIQNGDWIKFNDVDFKNGAASISASVSSGASGGTIEIRQGSTSGTLLGTVEVANTGSWTTWETVSSNTSSITGEQDIFLVFTGGSGYLLDIDWFTFTEDTTVNPCNSPLANVTPPSNITSGINYTYFEGSWNVLPNFGTLTPISNGIAPSIDLSNAASADNFGLSFEGYIDIPSDDSYTFYTTSDDGSALWIDGIKVVDNDGLHGAKEESGTICLEAGYHQIEVQFFEKTGGNVLSIAYEASGIAKTTSLDLYGTSVSTNCSIPWNDNDFTVSNTTVNYTSGAIDISCASTSLEVSMNIEGIGSMEDVDYLNIYYKIDGGSQQVISENVNAFSEKTVSVSGIRGNTIEIIINGATSVAAETYYVSNILVASNTNSGGTDCAGVVEGTATVDACGICSGGTTGINPTNPQTWYEDADGDGAGDPDTSLEQCSQPNGYVLVAGDNCPDDANKNEPGDCGCGVEEGTCSDCNNTTAFTEAECYDNMSGVIIESSNGDGENLGHLADGDWASYNDIDVSNMNSFNALLSTPSSGRSIEIRLDSENGTLVGTLSVPNTGAWHSYVNTSTNISNLSGTHDIFLIFRGGAFNIGSFGFTEEDIVEPSDCSDFFNGITV
ncbi:carbohydrate-binding protein, partial [Aquimarina pacifica]|uniref:carbohydrate-binding protein n=1 Tax=Aquimarina pacifica TaxID=1296415 RepID=UPI00046F573F